VMNSRRLMLTSRARDHGIVAVRPSILKGPCPLWVNSGPHFAASDLSLFREVIGPAHSWADPSCVSNRYTINSFVHFALLVGSSIQILLDVS